VSLRLYAFNCGWQTLPLGILLAGEHGRFRVPTPCYLIDHPKGKVLFDSGLHLDLQHDPAARGAQLVVQRREWEAGHEPDQIAANYYDPRNYDLGHDVLVVDGEHDLFGDGSVVCVPTWGHTPGHQSLRVRGERGEVVLAADACYLRRTLDDLHLPAVLHDREAMLRSLEALRALRDRGAQIFYGHDPEFWGTVPQAPAAVL
jgi:N-acyl homoserine lactone hydrolase